ncbi:MAG: alkaline phosphatase family protein [Candidatus Schekmanbacteria bacterium]|nr:alkaline phosphatase family protein [Candidatus Schekmanbacteria bacterium]
MTPPRVVVIGLDGLDPRWCEQWIAAGALPGLARLGRRGCLGRLKTTNPPQSPVAWSSIVTGLPPGAHGIVDFIRRRRGSYLPESATMPLSGNAPRAGVAVWDRVAAAGIPATALFAPVSYPPGNGAASVLCGLGVPDLFDSSGVYGAIALRRPGDSSPGDALHLAADGSWRGAVTAGSLHVVAIPWPGPRATGAMHGQAHLRLSLRASVEGGRFGKVEVSVEGQDVVSLLPGETSPWVRLRGPDGRFAVTRFSFGVEDHSSGPDMTCLYVGPLQIDPTTESEVLSRPPELAAELAARHGLFPTMGWAIDTWAKKAGCVSDAQFADLLRAVGDARLRLFRARLDRCLTDGGLLFAVFEATDRAAHVLHHLRDPEHPRHRPGDLKRFDEQMLAVCDPFDRLVGEVQAALGPDDLLVVLSDHGFSSYDHTVGLNTVLREAGLLAGDRAGRPALVGGEIDWTKTRAFALGMGKIWVNLRRRDEHGTVSPGAEAMAVRDEARRALLALNNGPHRVVEAVYFKEELFPGPFLPYLPDLTVAFAEGWRASSASALGQLDALSLSVNDSAWSGDHANATPHAVPGVILASDPHLLREHAFLDVLDIAPLIGRRFTVPQDAATAVRP